MVTDSQILDYVSERSEDVEGIDEIECQPHQETEQYGKDEGNDLVVRHGRDENADGGKSGAEEKQSDVGTPHGTIIDIPLRITQKIYGNEIYQRGYQGNDKQNDT